MVDGDTDLLNQIIDVMMSDIPKYMASIREAVAKGESEVLERYAHQLAGSISNLRCGLVVEPARLLERLGREKRLSEVSEPMVQLESDVDRLLISLPLLRENR